MSAVIQVENLRKTYKTPFRRRRVEALRGISFAVEPGEVFGFLGPNGAGKTTAIRILMGLISPTGGRATLFGHQVPSREARARLGFLPEAPYFYEYLTVTEMLDLAGRLFGMDRGQRRRRAGELIELVGLEHARDTPIKRYSKGMMQRAGIAQALMNDPELVVLDEPMSGLDPVGRRDVRDIIESLRARGKTVFFSSHILADVEVMSDRVGIVVRGQMCDVGPLSRLVSQRVHGIEVRLTLPDEGAKEALSGLTEAATLERQAHGEIVLTLATDADVDAYLARARELGARVVSVTPRHDTLEELFLRRARGETDAADSAPASAAPAPAEPAASAASASAAPATAASQEEP